MAVPLMKHFLYFYHMRLALLLGCLYVLLLSVRPCCADEDCALQAPAKLEQAHMANQPSKACTGCSPFYSCGTCTGFVMVYPAIHGLALSHLEINTIPLPAYLQPFVHEASQRIWQPPQLG
jgi:hypothetical protein